MAKKLKAIVRLQIQAGKANPAPPIGPALAGHGINLMAFCKEYNARTSNRMGEIVPAEITIYTDGSFTFILKTPPAAVLLKKAAGVDKGSAVPNRDKVGSVTRKQVREIAELKMKDLNANPLSYKEDKQMLKRRKEISGWLDATDPDLSEFFKQGGKIIITSGTQDFVASSGAQLDYYRSLVEKMKQSKLDQFARLYVVPQGGHNLAGRSYSRNGEGLELEVKNIPSPSQADRIDLLISWVEEGKAPEKTLVVSNDGSIGTDAGVKGYLLCSYPAYPRYKGGAADMASSYESTHP